jgi:LPPG:FO 2-phospho-L-lactate transferase
MPEMLEGKKIVVLAGGVGGSRLVRGMSHHLEGHQLTVIVNTGDDFTHCGLHISPDIDTVLYHLAGLAHVERGWGIHNDTFHCMDALKWLGGETWFNIGDRDLATHLLRTQLLQRGHTLTEVTAYMARNLGILHAVLPMSDDACRTMLDTDEGILEFQNYFVRQHWQPAIRRIFWQGAESARPTTAVMQALRSADLLVIAPSNPFVSVAPILQLPGVKEAVSALPVIAMSPIIGGMAVKGPAAKMFRELLGKPASVEAVVDFYDGLLDGLVMDEVDADLLPALQTKVKHVSAMPTLMLTAEKQVEAAGQFLHFAQSLLPDLVDESVREA